jgi:hypothetical protein
LRDEAERRVKEAMERKAAAVTQGNARIETKCVKCGPAQCRMMVPGERIELPTNGLQNQPVLLILRGSLTVC